MVYPIKVVGTGPGHEDYLLPVARKAVRECDCLFGAEKALGLFAHLGKPAYPLDKNIARLVPQLKNLRQKYRVAVLVSGDPGFYSLLAFLKKHFSRAELEVIPGISSVQLAFARIKETWQDARFSSVHGRTLEKLPEEIRPGQTVAVLTGGKNTPGAVARFLAGKIPGDPRVILCTGLSGPEETIIETKLSRVDQELQNSIMVITYEA